MPGKNTIRNYHLGGYYHVFNRGVDKRDIFQDEQDYRIFCYYLYVYLSPMDIVLRRYPLLGPNLLSNNLHNRVDLLAFCLMPNHFHLLLRLNSEGAASALLKQITNAYTSYFNFKYKRVGSLMQGRYKAVEVTSQAQLLHLSRYIHLNPVAAGLALEADQYAWSSMADYHTGQFRTYVSTSLLEENELTTQQYSDFVLSFHPEMGSVEAIISNNLIEQVVIED